ncbi:MAG TPA: LON peptidase substrate-binding domain-containing protein [Candidatus Krumholzibacteria bacterium]|nr:LON peptidase substrate-binding domain-containing protein [Candidatus Krumholzibacteria bacterium]
MIAPVFPLPSYFLFPGAASPLRVFEPRYRQMVEDLLDGPGRLVMACVDPAHVHEMASDPPVLDTGGLGEIARHRRLPNGEYLIWVVGLGRVRIEEVESDRLYRRAKAHLLEDDDEEAEIADLGLSLQLRDAIAEHSEEDLELPDEAPIGFLADVLAQCLPLPVPRLRECFEELDPRRRADLVLDEHRLRGTSPE